MGKLDCKYDRQAVIGLVDGIGDDAIEGNAASLMSHAEEVFGEKGHTQACFFCTSFTLEEHVSTKSMKKNKEMPRLKEIMKKLTRHSRLYIVGHGDWQAQKVASWDAHTVAKLLVLAGLPNVRTISLVCCQAGLNKDGTELTQGSANSFASQFHKELWKKHKIKTTVFARVYKMSLIKEGFQDQGRKYTRPDDEIMTEHHRPYSKKKFYWEKGKQVEEWVIYEKRECVGSNNEI